MHYETKYDTDKPEAKEKAMADIKSYLDDRYDTIVGQLTADTPVPTFESFEFSCGMFLGIEGYPVKVWYEELFGVAP